MSKSFIELAITSRDTFPEQAADRLGFQECAHAVLTQRGDRLNGAQLGTLEARRTEGKTGRWPFKKGEYTVVLNARSSDSETDGISSRPVFTGRFKSATAALREAQKNMEPVAIKPSYHGCVDGPARDDSE